MIVHLQLRRDTAANWAAANPVLLLGEVGLESDSQQMKVGNGTTAWNALPYGGVKGEKGATGTTGPTGPTGTLLGVVTITGTTRTLTAADNGYVLYCTSADAVTLTTASGLGAAFSCMVVQAGLGKITVVAGAGTTLASYGSMVKSAGQYATLTLFTPVADTFILAGQTT